MAPRVGRPTPIDPDQRQLLPIGAALRARRHKLGLTLNQLAEKSGLSAPFISQAERGQATPSIISLMNLSKALGVDINYFIDVPKTSQIVRRAAEPEYIMENSPARYVRLSGSLANRTMEALLITVPGRMSTPTVQREGEGFYYILEGQMLCRIGDDEFLLGPGDSMHFDQRHRYTMANPTDGTVRLLWVGTPPLFEQA